MLGDLVLGWGNVAVNLTMLEDSDKGMCQRRGLNHWMSALPEDLGLVPHPHGGSQPPETLIPGGSNTYFWPLWTLHVRDSYRQENHTYIFE